MKFKTLLFTIMFILCSALCVQAATIDVETWSAENITYYSATLNGYIPSSNSTISSYGIEIWSDDIAAVKTQIGSGSTSGQFTGTFYLLDNTTYSYRAYIKDKSSNYYYGETKTFKTDTRKIKESPEINFNISVGSLETINFADTPNKYFLNNLILNNQNTLKLIAGNNFDGIGGIMQAGGQNIFINQYFINEYYSDSVMRSLLSVFDGAVYNRDDFLWDTATSLVIPDDIAYGIYKLTPDGAKSTLNSIYGDMKVKRFTNAINKALEGDYTSSDKRTFGFDKTNYKVINSLSEGGRITNKLIKNINDGIENTSGLTDAYHAYYTESILPPYLNAQMNWFETRENIFENMETMSGEEYAQRFHKLYDYTQEIASYENKTMVDETFAKWKFNIESNYYAQDALSTLKNAGKNLSFYSSTLSTIKAINQVQNNKEQLYDTFDRLRNITDNKKLEMTLDDYLYKMDNGFASFLSDTATNLYNSYAKTAVQDATYDGLKKVGSQVITNSYGAYTSYVIDKALAKANYALIAVDVGGVFAEKISSTKTILEKAIEAKYLWNIENESKELLQRDLIAYAENQTEENAIAVLNDLFWLKALKLREITVTKELYNANGDNWLALANSKLGVISNGVDEIFESQRDALINASITETKYTSEPLTLNSGETYVVINHNDETGTNGSITTSSGTKLLQDAESRLVGGVTLKNGSTLSIMASDATVYIPFVTMESGANLIIEGGNVIIGEFNQNSGTLSIGENSNVNITGDVTFNNSINLDNSVIYIHGSSIFANNVNMNDSTMTIDGNVTANLAKDGWSTSTRTINIGNSKLNVTGDFIQTHGVVNVNSGNLIVDGDYSIYGYSASLSKIRATFVAGSGKTIIGGDFYSESYVIFKMKSESAFVLINGDFVMKSDGYADNRENLSAGTLELKGAFYVTDSLQTYAFVASGTHKVIVSGSDEQKIAFSNYSYRKQKGYFNILVVENSKAVFEDVKYNYRFSDIPYTLTFVTNTSAENINRFFSKEEQISITTQINRIGLLSKVGYCFKGWYLDEECTIPLTVENDIIASDITLYAKWTEPMSFNNVSYSSENNEISVNVSLDEELETQNGIVIIAVYDETKLITTHHTNTEETVSHTFKNVPITENGYTIKTFCWSNLETLVPLCNSISTTIK